MSTTDKKDVLNVPSLFTNEHKAIGAWVVGVHEQQARLLQRNYLECLDAEEQALLKSFRHAHDARSYMLAHCLRRAIVAQVLECPPATVTFTRAENGRPKLVAPGHIADINISHTKEWVACAISTVPHGRVGVDVESFAHTANSLEEYFHPLERNAISNLAVNAKRHTERRTWVVKEAYLKAVGVGLGLEPSAFATVLSTNRVTLLGRAPDDRWLTCAVAEKALDETSNLSLVHLTNDKNPAHMLLCARGKVTVLKPSTPQRPSC